MRNVCENPKLQYVGTSATLAGSGSLADQQVQIAEVASRLFGADVKPERVIGEKLCRVTAERDEGDPAFRSALATRVEDAAFIPPADFEAFLGDLLSSWIESTFGLASEPLNG